jgi:hypothetical protein
MFHNHCSLTSAYLCRRNSLNSNAFTQICTVTKCDDRCLDCIIRSCVTKFSRSLLPLYSGNSTLYPKMEELCFSETSVTTYLTIRRHSPEHHKLNFQRRKNYKLMWHPDKYLTMILFAYFETTVATEIETHKEAENVLTL